MAKRCRGLHMLKNEIFAIYKPVGMTSHDVVDRVRRATGERRVGHAGTLDPLARGVLVIGVGREATQRLGEVVKKEKEYVAKIRLGATSTTDDAEGELRGCFISSHPKVRPPAIEDIEKTKKKFVGKILQTPPRYSAVKIRGKEAYKRARKGEDIELQPREVEIKEYEIISYEWPILEIRVVTGPGVYIRSLARDIGEALGVGGYLEDLERTRVGEFTKDKALALEKYEEKTS